MRVRCEAREGPVWRVHMSPGQRGEVALTGEGIAERSGLVAAAAESARGRVIVIDSSPGVFCKGMDLEFWRIAMRPGKPLMFGRLGDTRILGLPEDEGQTLLEELCTHVIQPEFTYRHSWQPGTVVIWDNRCVVHYAEGGYHGHRRVMYRTTLAGEKPAV